MTTIKRIEIDYKRTPTEPMLRVGIYGRFTVNIIGDVDGNDAVLFQGNKATLRKSKAGEWYIEEPWEEYEKDGQKKKAYFYKLFAGMDRDARDKVMKTLIDKAKQEFNVENATATATTSSSSSSNSSSTSDDDPFS
jgi:hypothetical protein